MDCVIFSFPLLLSCGKYLNLLWCCSRLLLSQGYGAGYGAAAAGLASQQPPASGAAVAGAGTPAGYPDYSRMQVSQAGQPGAAGGGAPHVDSTVAADYSAYG